jgi:hypothetical protein
MAYVFGVDDVCNSLHKETKPDKSLMYASIYKQIDGKTWEKRLEEASTDEEIIRIAFTEAHRVFNEGQFDTGTELGAVSKVWHTQEDDRVRDSHWYLDGMEVGLDDYFYTLAGERALHPSGFGVPEEDINCRCYLEYR